MTPARRYRPISFSNRLSLTFRDTRHQHVMLDAVEKFRQVHVDALTISGTDVGLYLLRCSVGGAAWSKAETRFRESGIENRREDLQDGLLDQAIDHVWNSEISLTAIRFGNRLPPGRTGW